MEHWGDCAQWTRVASVQCNGCVDARFIRAAYLRCSAADAEEDEPPLQRLSDHVGDNLFETRT